MRKNPDPNMSEEEEEEDEILHPYIPKHDIPDPYTPEEDLTPEIIRAIARRRESLRESIPGIKRGK